MHVRDLFDMFAGTSTGSILASALSLKSTTNSSEPRYWATDANMIYVDSAPILFAKNGVSKFFEVICYCVFISAFAATFFLCGRHRYNNNKTIEAQQKMREFLENSLEVLIQKQGEETENKKSLIVPNLESKNTINWDDHTVEVRSDQSYEFDSDEG